jgi:DNA-binding transcriptional regulator GbsR (MarR family)
MKTLPNCQLDAFIERWGLMGVYWGLGKVSAEIQALLYLSARPLSLEDMSEKLKTSRSSISLNVRSLQDLGVVRKVIVPGDRKDYYAAEEDLGLVVRRLAAKKKKRELDPAIRIVDDAIRAASSAPPEGEQNGSATTAEKLRELKGMMEGIAGIFDAFIGDDQSKPRSAEAVELKTG